jgi:hypothetical protein
VERNKVSILKLMTRDEKKSESLSQMRRRERIATTCTKKVITWSYDIGFSRLSTRIKGNHHNLKCGRKNFKSKIEGHKHVRKSESLLKIRKRERTTTAYIEKLIT